MTTAEQTASAPSTNGSALLEVRHVSKYFGNVVALKDISVGVNAGEVTCVLGDNGAGKSTFIKILSGVHRHDEGELLVEGDVRHVFIDAATKAKTPMPDDVRAALAPA